MELVAAGPLVQSVGSALLHLLWQGAAIGLLTALVLRLIHREQPVVRYTIACCALAGLLVSPIFTGFIAYRSAAAPVYGPVGTSTADLVADSGFLLPAEKLGSQRPERATLSRFTADWIALEPRDRNALLTCLVGIWLMGVLALSVRVLLGWSHVRDLQRTGVRPAPDAWQARIADLAHQLKVFRPVRLLESAFVQVPTVIGWLRPVILLPASAAMGLTSQQLEAILLHELAHIRRHDYLVNILQVVVETVLFYHPAVWWLSSLIRKEREHCCDDLAISATGGPLPYARALLALEELRRTPNRLVLAADGGELLRRVQRLITPVERDAAPMRWVAGLLVITTLVAGVLLYRTAPGAAAPAISRDETTAVQAHRSINAGPGEASSRTQAAVAPAGKITVESGSEPASLPSDIQPIPGPSTTQRELGITPELIDPNATTFIVAVTGPEGIGRAEALASALAPLGIAGVYSTSDRHTVRAARPIADGLDASRIPYDYNPGDPDRFVRNLFGPGGIMRAPGRTVLVVLPAEVISAAVRHATGAELSGADLGSGELLVIGDTGEQVSLRRVKY
jgi:beta-lactamase regulating signal transducer with metallopeptidase domain